MASKKEKFKNHLPECDGLTLAEICEKFGLTQYTLINYIYELGGGDTLHIHGDKLSVDGLVSLQDEPPGPRILSTKPYKSGAARKDGSFIENGGLKGNARINPGSSKGQRDMLEFLIGIRELTLAGNEEVIQELERNGTLGPGKKLG